MSDYVLVTAATQRPFMDMAANLIISSRDFGRYPWCAVLDEPLDVGEDFHPMPAKDCELWKTPDLSKYWIKWRYLRMALERHGVSYAIWVDADCQFFGVPAFDRILESKPKAFCLLETDIFKHNVTWYWTPEQHRAMAKELGMKHPGFHNLNGGLVGIRRDAMDEFDETFERVMKVSRRINLPMGTDEPYLSFTIHLMNRDVSTMMAERNIDVFMVGYGYRRPDRFFRFGVNEWAVLPQQTRFGIVHIWDSDSELAKSGRERLKSFR